MASNTRTIGIVLFDGVEELDAVGPWEVLAWWTRTFPDDGYEVTTLAPDRRHGHVRQGDAHRGPARLRGRTRHATCSSTPAVRAPVR